MFEQEKKELERCHLIDDLIQEIQESLSNLRAAYRTYTCKIFGEHISISNWSIVNPRKILKLNKVKIKLDRDWSAVVFYVRFGWFGKVQFALNSGLHHFDCRGNVRYSVPVEKYQTILQEINQATAELKKAI